MPLKSADVRDRLDGTLAVLLAVLLVRRDIPAEYVHDPWRHVLGTLARNNLARAIAATPGFEPRSYRLHSRWSRHFPTEAWVVDHVFPVHQWKEPLLERAKTERWSLSGQSLEQLRLFVSRHYVTAKIPRSLHLALSRSTMPREWVYEGPESMWARYKTQKVNALMGRNLRVPSERDPDFILV